MPANRLDRKFAAERPNQVWLADITYVPTGERGLYLAAVLDHFTRKIAGWAMRGHMQTALTIAALIMAIQRQKPSHSGVDHPKIPAAPTGRIRLIRVLRTG